MLRKILFFLILALVLGLAGFYFWNTMTYSEGNRAGYLIKISKKGYIFKTYEGELNLGGVTSGDVTAIMGNNRWEFSVQDEAVYNKLQQYEGKQISVHYRQQLRAFPWQGDTPYFVDGVELVGGVETPAPPAPPAPQSATPQPQTTPQAEPASGAGH